MKFNKVEKHIFTPEEISDYIKCFEGECLPKLIDLEKYFEGNNPFILTHNNPDSQDAPNWKCQIPYGRKITNTVAGYMFKPGLINYTHKKESLDKEIKTFFKKEKEDIKTSQLGKVVSTFGFGYELFYIQDAEPTWVVADVKEIIPFYTTDIDPSLWCFIRFWDISNSKKTVTRMIDVYYDNEIQHFWQNDGLDKVPTVRIAPNINLFSGIVPLNVVINNKEMIGDFEPVTTLIDAYDTICSDGMIEGDRFAGAYLLMSDGISQPDSAKIKTQRFFEHLGKDGFVKFLTKDIPTQFFQFMKDWIKNEIHQQTHVPDFLNTATGPVTGAALDRLLYDFEFLCATKQSYFQEGLYNRFEIIDTVKNVKETDMVGDEIEITFTRNKPSDNLTNSQIYNTYKATGDFMAETLMRNFAPFVKDPEEELLEVEEKNREMMALYQTPENTDTNTSTEENTDTEENI